MEDIVTHFTNIVRRVSILGAFVALTSLTPSVFAPSALAADEQPDTAIAAAANLARPDGMSVLAPEHCSFTAPCQVARTSYSLEWDLGGPSIRVERFSDDD